MVRGLIRLCVVSTIILAAGRGPEAQTASPLNFVRTDTAAITAPRTITSADFNRDGFPDVALGGTGRASVGILFHHGLEDGDEGQRFKPLREIAVGGGPFEVTAADLNRDGLIDIAVANADSDAVTILLNDTTHQFTSVRHVAVPQNPRGLAIADFNRDGIPDIVVTKYMGTTIDVLLGAGDGTFPTRRTHSAPANAQGVATGDFDRNGWMDAAVVSVSGMVSVYYGHPTGMSRSDFWPGSDGWNVVTAADFDRNGTIDLALASSAGSVVRVASRDANNVWSAGPAMPVASSPRGIDAGDVNMDGRPDIVVAGRSSSTVTVLAQQVDGTYVRQDVAANAGARDVTVTDFNDDGRLDILTADEFGHSTTLLGNATDFGPSPAFSFRKQVIPDAYYNETFAVADFNENGIPDLVRDREVLLDGTTSTRPGLPFASAVLAGDFNLDGHADLIAHDRTAFYLYAGSGRGTFAQRVAVLSATTAGLTRAADFNRDGRLDLITVASTGVSNNQTRFLEVHLGTSQGSFALASRVETTFGPSQVADVNRDGILDVVGVAQDGIGVLLGDGAGGWNGGSTFGLGTRRYAVVLGDVTSDGVLDAVTADMTLQSYGWTASNRITVWRGLGDGTFEELVQYDTSIPEVFTGGIYSLMLADLDHDGHLDLFTGGGVMLQGGGMAFSGEPQRFAPWSGNTPPVALDMNRDGLLDIAGMMDQQSIVMLNTRTARSANSAPTGLLKAETIPWSYATYWYAEDESEIYAGGPEGIQDADLHAIRYTWTIDGQVVGRYRGWAPGPDMRPGSYQVTVTVDDYRGGADSHTFTLELRPFKETVLYPYHADVHGAWQKVPDPTAAGWSEYDKVRLTHPNANAPKLQAPLANPTDYVEFGFLADPTQEYKLWIRMKAENDHWANDSVFVQFTGAADAAGHPVYRLGSTSALAVNLEECSGCGVSGWGWEDDGWGAPDRNGVTLRFPEGGRQIIRIQTREDGVSIDQVVLSSEKYLTTRPGTAKNDTTILYESGPWIGTWWYYNR